MQIIEDYLLSLEELMTLILFCEEFDLGVESDLINTRLPRLIISWLWDLY